MAEVQIYKQSNCDVLGLALSGVPEPEYDAVHSTVKTGLNRAGVGYLGAVPSATEPRAASAEIQRPRYHTHTPRPRHRAAASVALTVLLRTSQSSWIPDRYSVLHPDTSS